MQSRNSLSALFSSFAIVEENGFREWIIDPRLRKSMEHHLAQAASEVATTAEHHTDSMGDRFWALYWHRLWLQGSHTQAEAHLSAYLQETCYWLAQKLHRKMLRPGVTSQYSAAELFQMTALELRPMLSSFDGSNYGNLKSFAQVALRYRLSATIRKQQLAGFCGDWGLLRKIGQKLLVEALRGCMEAEVERKRLLWLGFSSIYTGIQPKHGGQLPEPTEEQLQAIAQFYNQQRSSQLHQLTPSLTSGEVKTQLLETSQALRNYLYPNIPSLNESHFTNETGEVVEKQDLLTDSGQPSPLQTLLMQEKQQQQAEQHHRWLQLLKVQFDRFSDEMQQIICLTYVAELTQQKISKRLGIPQARISRRLRQGRQEILKAILAEYEALDKFPEPDQLNGVKRQLTECLRLLLPELGCCELCDELTCDDLAQDGATS